MSFKTYEKYKDSGIEWLGEVPAHWAITPLKNKYAIFGGSTPSADVVNWNGDIEWATPTDLNKLKKFEIKETARRITHKGLGNCGATLVPKNSIIISSRAPIGSIGITSRPLCTNQGCKSLVSGKENEPRFHTYLLSIATKELNLRGKGTTFLEISGEVLGAFRITAPPFTEQTTIAAFLDHETARIDALIEEQQRLIALLKEKRQAVISHTVTKGLDPNAPMKDSGVEWLGDVPAHWEVIAIKWLSIVQRGASPRPINDPIYFDDNGEYSWVRIADVSSSNGSLNYTPQKLSKLGSSMSVKINPGELFVSIAGTVGKPCISKIKACIHDGFVYFPQLKIPPRFLYTIFESGLCYKGLGKMGTQLNLNTDTIGGIKVAIPPSYDEITQILDSLNQKLKNIDDLASQAGHVTSLLQERRSALISAAVTGKIDVRDWQPPKANQTATEPAEAST